MNRKFLIIAISIIIFASAFYRTDGFGLLRSPTAFAVGDLVINWGVPTGDPIFDIPNAMPGDMETRTVNIENGASTGRPVGVRGVLDSDTGLASVMEIVISGPGGDLYGGTLGAKTLADFFADSADPSFIKLFTLGPGDDTGIDFKVTFMESSDNQYQNQSIVFDIKIGIAFDLPAECEDLNFSGDTIFGTAGNDNLNGGSGGQIIVGLEGNDKIRGGNGDDCLIGGEGDDNIKGGNGKDIISGDEGNDTIDGGNDQDIIFGGAGDDDIKGGNRADQIFGGLGNDKLDAGNGEDIVEGQEGNDKLLGGPQNDTLTGGPGNDSANGGTGTDTCDAETETTCEL